MDQNKETKKVPLAGELPETKLPVEEVTNTTPTVIDLNEPKDYSHLPVGTQTSIELDKKSMLPSNPPLNNSNNIVPKSVLKNDYSKKFFKIALGIFGVFLACFLIFLGLSVTNLDTKLIKITLNGQVTDANTGLGVKDASIIIGGSEVGKTNTQGNYSIGNLNPGDVSVTVKADGYDDVTENVRVSKVLLDYTTNKNFVLKSSITGVLSGKLIPTSAGYKFTNDKLTIGEKQYTIADDGSFNIPNVKVGDVLFKFSSANYKDISQNITVQSGSNKIPDITLVAGGDIVGELKSYIKEDLVLNTKFYVENILQDQVSIAEDGKFAVKDLDTGKKYKIRVTADGYKTRDYEININQGENQLFNFKLVEDGIAIIPLKQAQTNNSPVKLYKADLDGANQSEVSSDLQIDLNSKFFSIEEQKLYYQSTSNSTYRQVASGGPLNMPYVYDFGSSVTDRLTVNTSDLGALTPNFIAKKMFNVYLKKASPTYQQAIQIMDLDGSNRKDVKAFNTPYPTISNLKISNNGKVALFSYNDGSQDTLDLYNIESGATSNVIKGNNIKVYDISEDGNLILLQRKNPNTTLTDLVLINIATDDLRTLKENIKGFDYQFAKGNSNKVIFFESRESRSNIYTFTIDRSQEEKITSLTPDYQISNIYQESNLVFYFTNKGLLVLDLNKPKNFKLVSADAYNFPQN